MTTRSDTTTRDPAERDGWSRWSREPASRDLSPRLRLLYHADLDRFGALTPPGAFDGGAWITLGRYQPSFIGPGRNAQPLADPQVSRAQLRVRYLAEAGCFEVEPIAEARRPLARVRLGDPPELEAIAERAAIGPGECLAIGDRVLLGFDLGRCRPADADRLGLVGESEAMWSLREEVASVAKFGRPVLVCGPTGSGKELVARALHRASPRAAGPFVAVNCAALPEQLVESALFGHKKGSFTGADRDEAGLFAAANGGTLLLDELGELPLAVQPKLLRVLEDGVVVPVGARDGRRVDARVVAATHRDLPAQIRAGELREDLYHRIAAHVLQVPALAERRFDIPELFGHFFARLRVDQPGLEWLWERGRAWRPALPIGFVAQLLSRELAGNVRELANSAERTARKNLEPGNFRTPDEVVGLPFASAEPTTEDPPATPRAPTPPPELLRAASEILGIAQKTALKLLAGSELEAFSAARPDAEWIAGVRAHAAEALLAVLEAHAFAPTDVAAALGTSRTTLVKLMTDLGLPRATDLGADEIARAREQAGGDLDQAARLLRVSASALKKRIAFLRLKSR